MNNNYKPTGYYMRHQVLQINDNSRTNSAFMCSVRWLISTQTAIISLHCINLLIFITEMKCLLFGATLHASSADLSIINFTEFSKKKITSKFDPKFIHNVALQTENPPLNSQFRLSVPYSQKSNFHHHYLVQL